jgi:hypothetical protein
MSIATELAEICKDLRMLGDDELTKKALCAYAAATDTERPRVDLSYSSVMRKLRKGDKDRRLKFQKVFKDAFDRALYEDVEEPAELALMVAMKAIDFKESDA